MSRNVSITPGLGMFSTRNSPFMWIHYIDTHTQLSMGDLAVMYGGFPLALGTGYQCNDWAFELEAGAMLTVDEGLIGLYGGPKISRSFGTKK